MASTQFLAGPAVWRAIDSFRPPGQRLTAVVGFVTSGGQGRFKLRDGDVLVADVSEATARESLTDPFEIGKLLRRGVRVFRHRCLHAKFLISGHRLLVGSANLSQRSHDVLFEAAMLTTDPSAVRAARGEARRLAVAEVTPEFLAACKRAWVRPRLVARRRRPTPEAPGGRLFFVGTKAEGMPDFLERAAERADRVAKKRVRHRRTHTTDHFYSESLKGSLEDRASLFDWVIVSNASRVNEPAQLQNVVHAKNPDQRSRGGTIFVLEVRKRPRRMSWTRFRRLARQAGVKRLHPTASQREIKNPSARAALMGGFERR